MNRDVIHCLRIFNHMSNNSKSINILIRKSSVLMYYLESNFKLMMENLAVVLPFLNSADPEKIRMAVFTLNGCLYSAMDLGKYLPNLVVDGNIENY